MTLRTRIDKILEVFLVIIMGTLVLDVVWQVLCRYLNRFLIQNFSLQIPSAYFTFTDELAGFLLIWVGMAGAAYVKGQNEHLAIDILHGKLSPISRTRLMIFINFLIIIFCLSIMVAGGIWLVYTRFVLGQISAALQIPIGYVYMIVPISGLLMTYYAADDIKLLKNELKTLQN